MTVLDKIRFKVDELDEKIIENKEQIGYPLHYRLHVLCTDIYRILQNEEEQKHKKK